jgi:BirA family transcriptional regulator, biotin operon repressor / biotin---[acetyl-CoA-carboxylase] ligase
MDQPLHLLSLLVGQDYHSGQALGEALGISRAAVWKHLQTLQQQGVDIESRKGCGYRLSAPLTLLCRERINQALPAASRALLRQLTLVPRLGSTNQHLLDLARQGHSIHGQALLAEQQTAGRGRRGRSWVSPLACNLYLSLGWQLEQGVSGYEGISLALGVQLVDRLERLGVQGLSLKWPNDILLQGRKLGGLLIEMGGDLSGQCHLVVGLGLNLYMPSATAEITQPWASLQECQAFERNQLAGALIGTMLDLLNSYPASGLAPYRDAWNARNAYYLKPIDILTGEQRRTATCLDIDASGALRVRTAQGIDCLHGGEISLRLHEPQHD